MMTNEKGNNNEKERISNKLDFYLDKKIMVHIELINNRFLNGHLIKKESGEVYELSERVLGSMHLFVSDVKDVSEFRELRE